MEWLIVSSIVAVGTVLLAAIATWHRTRRIRSEAAVPARLGSVPASPIVSVPATVLFDRPDKFAVALGEASLENLNRTLATRPGAGDSTSLVVQGVKYVRSSDTIEWTLSRGGQEGVRQGRMVGAVPGFG